MEMMPPRPSAPTPITDKEAMAKANIEETNRAHEMAAQRRAQDAQEEPLINVLAGSIKDKLAQLPPPEEETAAE